MAEMFRITFEFQKDENGMYHGRKFDDLNFHNLPQDKRDKIIRQITEIEDFLNKE